MSNSCQKHFSITIGTAPSALQLDAVTVAQQNTWAAQLQATGCPAMTYTGRMINVGGSTVWAGDANLNSVRQPPFDPNAPPTDWEFIFALYCGSNEVGVASYEKAGPDPVGVYNLLGYQLPASVSGVPAATVTVTQVP